MFQNLNEAIEKSSDWREAVTNVIDFYTSKDMCFSSGEIAAAIRTSRPELQFSVYWIGEYVRDLFYGGAIEYRVSGNVGEGISNRVPAFQVPRETEGLEGSRTPPGVEVFVYGPHPSLCKEHSCEVAIPRALEGVQLDPEDAPGRGEEWHEDEKTQTLKNCKFTVRVHSDKRVCFTRPVLEAFFHVKNHTVSSRGEVYIKRENGRLELTLEEVEGSNAYQLSASRGRVLFPLSDMTPGSEFGVNITKNAIVVELQS